MEFVDEEVFGEVELDVGAVELKAEVFKRVDKPCVVLIDEPKWTILDMGIVPNGRENLKGERIFGKGLVGVPQLKLVHKKEEK